MSVQKVLKFSEYNQSRVRQVNAKPWNESGKYILYWMQAYRRFNQNHALSYCIHLSHQYKKELVVYEGLRMDYPWSSPRFHKFLLEGMLDNQKQADLLGLNYWSFVETIDQPANGILESIASNACVVVTDDFPCFIAPLQTNALSKKIQCSLLAVDSNSIIPLSLYEACPSAARILRYRVHRLFAEGYVHRAEKITSKDLYQAERTSSPLPKQLENESDIFALLSKVQYRNKVEPVEGIKGGSKEAEKLLDLFINHKMEGYTGRSNPNPPENTPVSNLSAYLHFGNISVELIIEKVLNHEFLGVWAPDQLNYSAKGKKEGFFSKKEYTNSFLDELITWRDLSYLMFWQKKEFRKNLDILPDWVKKNLEQHKLDTREYIYTKEDLENYRTHDPLWNAAQKELVLTGRIHNYMRMLWGKKVIEWTHSYKEAFYMLEDWNNKYAYDGRDPNSYSGILWCFGMFDKPWFPERNVLGTIRYMSSSATTKKFQLKKYLEYVERL